MLSIVSSPTFQAGVEFVVGCTVAATIAMSLPPSLKELAVF